MTKKFNNKKYINQPGFHKRRGKQYELYIDKESKRIM